MGMSLALALALFSSFPWKKKKSPKSTRRVRGRKRLRRGNNLVSREIPFELQIEILTRLPAKSLMRFKCVSKLWFSLIRSRYFSNLYFAVASPPRSPLLYMSVVEHLIECDSMEVCHNPGKSLLVSLTSSSSNNGSLSFQEELTMPGMGGHDMVVLRGLILYIDCRKACIYNPTTRQSLTLPAVKSNIFSQEEPRKYVYYDFGYDHVLDQYKVVCSVVVRSEASESLISEHWVLVLEVGGSWKRIEFDQPHMPTRLGLCINGVIYYLASTCMSRSILVSFDVRCEEFDMIQVPQVLSAIEKVTGFIEYGGRPAILDHTNLVQKGMVNLWVLEDGGKWSKKSLVLQLCQRHLVNNDIELKVEGTTRNGEVILAPNPFHSRYYILYYDLQKNDLRKVDIIRGISDHGSLKTYNNLALMDKSESIMHLET